MKRVLLLFLVLFLGYVLLGTEVQTQPQHVVGQVIIHGVPGNGTPVMVVDITDNQLVLASIEHPSKVFELAKPNLEVYIVFQECGVAEYVPAMPGDSGLFQSVTKVQFGGQIETRVDIYQPFDACRYFSDS